MQVGVTFPQTEIGADPEAIRDYAQAVEGMGYSHLVAFDHVLGADPTHRPGWQGYTHREMFHEPFVLFGYLAALTHLELVPAVIILPQRQTVLVAKQAAEVDVSSIPSPRQDSILSPCVVPSLYGWVEVPMRCYAGSRGLVTAGFRKGNRTTRCARALSACATTSGRLAAILRQ